MMNNMLTLNKITLKNFISHGSTEIVFKPGQKILIDGKSGSGKSSIVEALVWVLYGQGRADNRSLIKRGSTAASVELVLNAGEDKTYTIHRSINNKGKHELKVSWCGFESKKDVPVPVAGLKNLQEYIEKTILKSSYLLFVNSVVYPQDNIDSFVKQTAARRKDIILEIINATGFDQYNTKAKDVLSKHKTDLSVVESQIFTIDLRTREARTIANKLPELQEQEKKVRKEYEDAEKNVLALIQEEAAVKHKMADLDAKRAKVAELQDTWNKNCVTIEKNRARITESGVFTKESIEEKLAPLSQKRVECDKLEKQQNALVAWINKSAEIFRRVPPGNEDQFQNEIQQINSQLIKLITDKAHDLPDWVCPQCQLVTPVDTIVPQIAGDKVARIKELEERLEHKTKQLVDFKTAMKEYEDELRMLGERPVVDAVALQALREEIKDLGAYELRLATLEANKELVVELQSRIDVLTEDNYALAKSRDQLTAEIEGVQYIVATQSVTISQKTASATSEKNLLQELLEGVLGALTEARSADRALEDDIKQGIEASRTRDKLLDDINSLELVKDAFGPRGVRVIVVDYIIPQLEEKINNILSKISDFRIRLDTQRSGLSGETTLEGLFISIFNAENEELDFDSYSGGERVKIIMAISEALSEVQQTGFRVLDEAFLGLDAESIDGFAEAMTMLQERFEQLICISHIDAIKTLFPERITVLKRQGTSVLV